jgi:hypothetical protein
MVEEEKKFYEKQLVEKDEVMKKRNCKIGELQESIRVLIEKEMRMQN